MSSMHHLPASVFVLLLMATATATWSSFFLVTDARQLEPAHAAAGGRCIGRERDALLAFKQGITLDPRGYLRSWQQGRQNCCQWVGVACSNATGHVIRLDLGYTYSLVGQISPSLLSLEYLEYLNLNSSDLHGPNGGIPGFLGAFKNLRHLDLSFMNFTSTVPRQLGNLSKLEYLDLGHNWNIMHSTDISWLTRLPLLVHLDMSETNLSSVAADWPLVVNMLPSLEYLSLSWCSISSANRILTHINLTNLQQLDLSFNYFEHPIASAWFWNLTSLTYLDITETRMSGPFPNALGNMTSLQVLHFCCYPVNYLYPDTTTTCNTATMTVDLRNLCDLEELWLDGSFSYGNITTFLERLPRCRSNRLNLLTLESNNMDGIMPDGLGQLTSLIALRISYNNITGSIPLSIGNLSYLEYLDLSHNHLAGPIPPELGNCTSLRYIYLSNNHLTGPIPPELGNCTSLFSISLSNNNLAGPIPLELGNCTSLNGISLSNNNLAGPIPPELGNCTSLNGISLSNNNLAGPIPPELGNCNILEHISLSNNHLTGPIPLWIEKLSVLDLSSNNINGHIPPLNSTRLEHVDLSTNNLIWPIPQGIANCPRLLELQLSDNHLTGPIPQWLGNCTSLTHLHLSNNHLTGHVPFNVSLPSNLVELDISNNKMDGVVTKDHLLTLKNLEHIDFSNNSLSGPLPLDFGAHGLIELTFSFNYFTGHIPESICKLRNLLVLDLSNNFLEGELPQCSQKPKLVFLHLSNNLFNGNFPSTLQNYSSLAFMDLSRNNFYGTLPLWIGDLVYLRFLQLSHNFFSGDIPVTITNLKRLRQLSLSGNAMSGVIPWSLSNLLSMAQKHPKRPGLDMSMWYSNMVGKLREVWPVVMKRQELKYGSGVFDVVSLDLSLNQLVGGIPEEVTSLTGLLNLNLSCNHLSGKIPAKIGAMKSIESLDLSRNNLSGEIPSSLANLTYLSSLDLSYNNLEGRIPHGSQLDTLYTENPSIYTMNIGLCGPPLERNCSGHNTPKHEDHQRVENVSEPVLFFYFGLGSGFLVGLWIVFCALLFKKSWRIAYFRLFDKLYDNAYVSVVVTWSSVVRQEVEWIVQ